LYLSKSKYCSLWQCPKLLWLDSNRRELRTEDSAVQDRMVVGNEVGDLAMGLFGDFTEVTVMNGDRPDISAMLKMTQDCLDNDVENICEASFSYNGLYCAVDILRKEKGGRAIYEVKSSTHEAEIYGIDMSKSIIRMSFSFNHALAVDSKFHSASESSALSIVSMGTPVSIDRSLRVICCAEWV